jgi:hypothetical protein
VTTKEGCVSFGFLIAQPVRKLKAQLAQLQAARADQIQTGPLEQEPLG